MNSSLFSYVPRVRCSLIFIKYAIYKGTLALRSCIFVHVMAFWIVLSGSRDCSYLGTNAHSVVCPAKAVSLMPPKGDRFKGL